MDTIECTWPVGRPSSYHSGLCQDLVNKKKLGWTNARVAADWGISEVTFYVWIKEHPELTEAYAVGQTAMQAWFEEFGYKMMTGEVKGDFKPWIAHMNKHFGYSGTNPTQGDTVHIGNMNVLSMDYKEIDKKLEQLMDKYGAKSLPDLREKIIEHE